MTQNTTALRAMAVLFLLCFFPALTLANQPQKKAITNFKIKKPLIRKQIRVNKDANHPQFQFAGETYQLLDILRQGAKAQNIRNGRVGEISGDIVVTFHPEVDVQEFLRSSNWTVRSAAPQIKTVFLSIQNFETVFIDLDQLKKDPRIKTAEIEVIESRVKPK